MIAFVGTHRIGRHPGLAFVLPNPLNGNAEERTAR